MSDSSYDHDVGKDEVNGSSQSAIGVQTVVVTGKRSQVQAGETNVYVETRGPPTSVKPRITIDTPAVKSDVTGVWTPRNVVVKGPDSVVQAGKASSIYKHHVQDPPLPPPPPTSLDDGQWESTVRAEDPRAEGRVLSTVDETMQQFHNTNKNGSTSTKEDAVSTNLSKPKYYRPFPKPWQQKFKPVSASFWQQSSSQKSNDSQNKKFQVGSGTVQSSAIQDIKETPFQPYILYSQNPPELAQTGFKPVLTSSLKDNKQTSPNILASCVQAGPGPVSSSLVPDWEQLSLHPSSFFQSQECPHTAESVPVQASSGQFEPTSSKLLHASDESVQNVNSGQSDVVEQPKQTYTESMDWNKDSYGVGQSNFSQGVLDEDVLFDTENQRRLETEDQVNADQMLLNHTSGSQRCDTELNQEQNQITSKDLIQNRSPFQNVNQNQTHFQEQIPFVNTDQSHGQLHVQSPDEGLPASMSAVTLESNAHHDTDIQSASSASSVLNVDSAIPPSSSSHKLHYVIREEDKLVQIGQCCMLVQFDFSSPLVRQLQDSGELNCEITSENVLLKVQWSDWSKQLDLYKTRIKVEVSRTVESMDDDSEVKVLKQLFSGHDNYNSLRQIVENFIQRYGARLMEITGGCVELICFHDNRESAVDMTTSKVTEEIRATLEKLLLTPQIASRCRLDVNITMDDFPSSAGQPPAAGYQPVFRSQRSVEGRSKTPEYEPAASKKGSTSEDKDSVKEDPEMTARAAADTEPDELSTKKILEEVVVMKSEAANHQERVFKALEELKQRQQRLEDMLTDLLHNQRQDTPPPPDLETLKSQLNESMREEISVSMADGFLFLAKGFAAFQEKHRLESSSSETTVVSPVFAMSPIVQETGTTTPTRSWMSGDQLWLERKGKEIQSMIYERTSVAPDVETVDHLTTEPKSESPRREPLQLPLNINEQRPSGPAVGMRVTRAGNWHFGKENCDEHGVETNGTVIDQPSSEPKSESPRREPLQLPLNINEQRPSGPAVGMRVTRAGNWHFGKENCDEHGVETNGTVIDQPSSDSYTVWWDNGRAFHYRENDLDLKQSTDYRKLKKHEMIDIGTRVKRGPDWRFQNQDGGNGKLGVVIGVDHAQGIVKVKWDTGFINDYGFGVDGRFDVEVFFSHETDV